MDTAIMIVGIGAITLICGAAFYPWGFLVLPAGLVLAWLIDPQ
jgi:hypothetical protein